MNNSIIDKNTTKLKQPFESVGRLIINQREGLGMNRAEMAVAINCAVNTIAKWEAGSVLPQSCNILALSELFGLSPENILMGMSCIESAENETVEQAELTNSALCDLSQAAADEPADLFTRRASINEPASFHLTFQGSQLVSVLIEQEFHVIDLQVTDFPALVIDAIAEAVRGKS